MSSSVITIHGWLLFDYAHTDVCSLMHHLHTLLQATLGADESSYDQYRAFKLFEAFPNVRELAGHIAKYLSWSYNNNNQGGCCVCVCGGGGGGKVGFFCSLGGQGKEKKTRKNLNFPFGFVNLSGGSTSGILLDKKKP